MGPTQPGSQNTSHSPSVAMPTNLGDPSDYANTCTIPLHIHTPLLASRPLSLICGRSIKLKLDAMQPPGSFKIRGVGHACLTYYRQGARRFISSSGGNAGIAVAYAGRCLSLPVTVVVPETTSIRAQELLKMEGANLIVKGASWQEANAHAQSMVGPQDAFLHPFDDPLLWEGHASLIDEVALDGQKPDAVVLSVGGGGLLAGVIKGLRRHGWHDVPVIGVETEGADSYNRSIMAGRRIKLDKITSLATSLGAKQVCEEAFNLTRKHEILSVVVSDHEAVSACLRFLDDHRILVEPACGAALAPIYSKNPVLEPFHTVLVVVCGGVTTSAKQMCQWLNEQS